MPRVLVPINYLHVILCAFLDKKPPLLPPKSSLTFLWSWNSMQIILTSMCYSCSVSTTSTHGSLSYIINNDIQKYLCDSDKVLNNSGALFGILLSQDCCRYPTCDLQRGWTKGPG
jgi:hypothetical protein